MTWTDGRSQAQRDADDLLHIQLARRNAYPALGDQLDALWHAMDQGLLPKVVAFYDPIAAVKAAYPKPSEDAGRPHQ